MHEEKIRAALAKLDPENDDHWTTDGLPRMEVVAKDAKITNIRRTDITDAAPEFTRDNPVLGDQPAEVVAEDKPAEPAEDKPAESASREEYDEILEQLVADKAEAEEARDEAVAAVDEIKRKLRETTAERDAKFPPMSQAEMIKNYQRGQQKQRAATVERAAQAKAAFGVKGLPGGRAPIDEARQKK